MPGCSTPPIGSRQDWLETGRANRSTSKKPIPRSRSVGRAAIGLTERHSFTRIEIPAGSPRSSATRRTSSADPFIGNFKYLWLGLRVLRWGRVACLFLPHARLLPSADYMLGLAARL